MNSFIKYSGVVALVLVVVMGLMSLGGKGSNNGLAGSTACSGITCLEGGLRLVSDVGGDFESDVAALFGSTVGITGATTLSSTLSVAATTTLADTVKFTNPGLCINFFATSTATQLHLTASTTGTLPGAAAAVITADWGACTN